MIKSHSGLLEQLTRTVQRLHPYDEPEVPPVTIIIRQTSSQPLINLSLTSDQLLINLFAPSGLAFFPLSPGTTFSYTHSISCTSCPVLGLLGTVAVVLPCLLVHFTSHASLPRARQCA